MEANPLSPSATTTGPVTEDDFYGSDSPVNLPTPPPAVDTPAAAPATGQPPAATSPPATAPASPAENTVADEDDLFEKPEAPAPPNPPAATAPTPPAQPGTAPAESDAWTTLTSQMSLPPTATAADVQRVIQDRIAQAATRQGDPLAQQLTQIEGMLSITENQKLMGLFLRQKMEREDGFVDEEEIADKLQSWNDNGSLTDRAEAFRRTLESQKTGISQQQQQQAQVRASEQAQVRASADAFRRELKTVVTGFKNDSGQPLAGSVIQELTEGYMYNGGLLEDLNKKLSSDPAFVFELAQRLHPTYGPKFQKMAARRAEKTGSSQVWKQLESGTMQVGSGVDLPDTSPAMSTVEDFYN